MIIDPVSKQTIALWMNNDKTLNYDFRAYYIMHMF